MNAHDDPLLNRARELREAFDRSFAEAPSEEASPFEDLLAIRIGDEPFAIRLIDIERLAADKTIAPLPSPVGELIGLSGFRGEIVPVYDLRLLLGYPARERTRWLVLLAQNTSHQKDANRLALAFDQFEAHVRVPPESIRSSDERMPSRYIREAVRISDGTRAILDIRAIAGTIVQRVQQLLPQRER